MFDRIVGMYEVVVADGDGADRGLGLGQSKLMARKRDGSVCVAAVAETVKEWPMLGSDAARDVLQVSCSQK